MYARTLALIALLLAAGPLAARNVDLSTVPGRTGVQLTIYNSEDLTLVRETRVLVFKQGINPLQFSWANTLIDPTSVELRFRTHADGLRVIDTTFPHDRPQALYWNVEAKGQVEAEIEISYFTSGIRWSADYVGIATADESTLAVTGYVRVDNQSGEQYDEAQVRLVVGKINLVEKIAQLAQRPVGKLEAKEYDDLKRRALREEMVASAPAPAVSAKVAQAGPKEVEKEGLSEYFIYTIEGTETVPNGWAKRLQSFVADRVPLTVRHRYRPMEYGNTLVRLYLLTNERAGGLGTTPLPDGSWRLFRRNPDETLSYLANVHRRYVPIGDKVELNLGADPNVLFEERPLRNHRDNIWMRYTKGNILYKVGDPQAKIELDSSPIGWDEHELLAQRIRNYGARPITVEVRRQYDGDVTFKSDLKPRLQDYRTVEYTQTVAPGERKELLYEVTRREGHNSKQSRVELAAGAVAR